MFINKSTIKYYYLYCYCYYYYYHRHLCSHSLIFTVKMLIYKVITPDFISSCYRTYCPVYIYIHINTNMLPEEPLVYQNIMCVIAKFEVHALICRGRSSMHHRIFRPLRVRNAGHEGKNIF